MSSAEQRLARDVKTARSLEAAHAFADRTLARARKARAVSAALPEKVAPGATKEERRKDRNTRASEIRAAVMERAGGLCEWCHRDGFALEWAHVIDGSGSRRAHEAVETTAGICADCHHRGWHRSRMDTFRAAKEWALAHGFREALAAIEKRIAHVEEVRR